MTDTRAAFEAWWGQPPQELIQCAQPDEALSMWVWQAWQAGVAAEREAIAKFCEENQVTISPRRGRIFLPFVDQCEGRHEGMDYAHAIRAGAHHTPAQGEAQS